MCSRVSRTASYGWLAVLWVVVLGTAATPAVAVLPTEAALVFDYDPIYTLMPVSGYLEFSFADDVKLLARMSYFCDSYVIEVQKPDFSTIRVDRDLIVGGLEGACSGRLPSPQLLAGGRKYRVAVFLLKTVEGKFVFDIPGKYHLQFILADIDPRPVAVADVEVLDCVGCDVADYLRSLPSGPALMPFGNDSIGVSDNLETGHYGLAKGIYVAYNQGGSALGRVIRSPRPESKYYKRPVVEEWVRQGRHWASLVNCNEGMWDVIEANFYLIKADSVGVETRSVDKSGVEWLAP